MSQSSQSGALRRNRARRKIDSLPISPSIKNTMAVLLNLLSRDSNYSCCWPSSAYVAKLAGISRRTAIRHLGAIHQTGMFEVIQLTPEQLKGRLECFGIKADLSRCTNPEQAPNLLLVNNEHPIWSNIKKMPSEDVEKIVSCCSEMARKANRSRTKA